MIAKRPYACGGVFYFIFLQLLLWIVILDKIKFFNISLIIEISDQKTFKT